MTKQVEIFVNEILFQTEQVVVSSRKFGTKTQSLLRKILWIFFVPLAGRLCVKSLFSCRFEATFRWIVTKILPDFP
ncbi:MAG: hypothetical protein ACE5I1_22295, partial [bacterium]